LLLCEKGHCPGKRYDLTGSGLIRIGGGWPNVKAMRKAKFFQKSDERVLGGGDFIELHTSSAQERMEQKYALLSCSFDLDKVAERVSELLNLKP
jgi:putative transposase